MTTWGRFPAPFEIKPRVEMGPRETYPDDHPKIRARVVRLAGIRHCRNEKSHRRKNGGGFQSGWQHAKLSSATLEILN